MCIPLLQIKYPNMDCQKLYISGKKKGGNQLHLKF